MDAAAAQRLAMGAEINRGYRGLGVSIESQSRCRGAGVEPFSAAV